MKAFTVCLFLSFKFCGSFSQEIKQIDTFTILTLKENQKTFEAKIDRLEKDFQKLEANNIDTLKSNKDDIKSLLNIYLSIAIGAIALIAFSINFFGRTAIKKRSEEIIQETAQKHTQEKIIETLNSKLTNELIENIIKEKSYEEINRILNNIESQGTTVINEIKNKGDEAIKLMIATPPITSIVIHNPNEEEAIDQNNSIQADELFNLAFNSNDNKLQVSLYSSVLDLQPNNVAALNNLGVAYNELRDTKNAIQALTKAINLDNLYYLAYANRGNSYYIEGKFEKGHTDLDKAIELNKMFYYSYSIKGQIFKKQNRLFEAEEILKISIKENSESPEAHFTLGFYYEESQQYEKSLKYYEKALNLNFPNLAMLYNNLAVLYRRQKLFDKAIEYLEKARQITSDFPNLDGTMALIYSDKNDEENFFKYLKIALEKGCKVWEYLDDPAFNKYRNTKRLALLIEPFKNKYFAIH